MKLHTIAKFGGTLSIILFLIGVGMYGFAKLSEAGEGKDMDLFTLVPRDCIGVLETDNLDYFLNEFPQTSYAEHLNAHSNTGLVNSILKDITHFSSAGAHRLGNQMNHLIVSFHRPSNVDNAVVYFKMGKESKRLLADIFLEKGGDRLNPKRESYRGEDIIIYPLDNTRFVSVYNGKGFLVVSYQKRLIEEVIDAKKDETSLAHDLNFTSIKRTKTANYMTFYGKAPALPILGNESIECWNEFDIHLNSDVFYLTGVLYGNEPCVKLLQDKLNAVELKSEADFLVVSGQHAVDSCISEAIVTPHNELFDECVSTLSRDASYIMVADLDQVANDPDKYQSFIPAFVNRNLDMFRSFILSVQVTDLQDRLSHIFVFTYKN